MKKKKEKEKNRNRKRKKRKSGENEKKNGIAENKVPSYHIPRLLQKRDNERQFLRFMDIIKRL